MYHGKKSPGQIRCWTGENVTPPHGSARDPPNRVIQTFEMEILFCCHRLRVSWWRCPLTVCTSLSYMYVSTHMSPDSSGYVIYFPEPLVVSLLESCLIQPWRRCLAEKWPVMIRRGADQTLGPISHFQMTTRELALRVRLVGWVMFGSFDDTWAQDLA